MGLTVIVVAIAVIVNLVVQELPSKFREIDLSTQKLYTIGEQTKKILEDLDTDVELYFIAQDGSESSDIQKLLEKYEEEQTCNGRAEGLCGIPDIYSAVYHRQCQQ